MNLWPKIGSEPVHGVAQADVFEDERGKPVLKLTFGAVEVVATANIVEMLGGIATGARKRLEDHETDDPIGAMRRGFEEHQAGMKKPPTE